MTFPPCEKCLCCYRYYVCIFLCFSQNKLILTETRKFQQRQGGAEFNGHVYPVTHAPGTYPGFPLSQGSHGQSGAQEFLENLGCQGESGGTNTFGKSDHQL